MRSLSRNISRLLGVVLGTLLSIACLILVARGIRPEDLAQALAETSPGYVALAVLSYALSIWSKAQRWRLLFYPRHRRIRLKKLASVILIGQMANVWLLARSGDLARAYLIGRIEGVNKAGALGTIVLEKSLESLMLLLSLGLLALLMPLPNWLKTSSVLLSGAFVALLFVLMLAAHQRERIITWGERWVPRFPVLRKLDLSRRLITAGESLELLRRMEINLQLVAWSAFVWIVSVWTNQLALQAVGIAVAWYVPLFLLVVFYVGSSLPASPGRFGIFHYLAVLSLGLFAVERDRALSFAIVLHTIAYVLMGAVGALCLWRENLALQSVEQPAPAEEKP